MTGFHKFPKRTEWGDDFNDLIDEHKDEYNYFRDDLLICYKMVENFIKKNARILVGGMSIDFALKAVGDKLYDGLKIDYDFISFDYFNDAYTLGNQLAEKFPDISIICARHISTMRVRYKFMPVADITYVPKNLYDKVEYLEYDGFRVIHPHFQMIDQMRALFRMAENPPNETYIGDRLGKDIKRFCMLSKYYGFDDKFTTVKNVTDFPHEKSKKTTVEQALIVDLCVAGFPAVIYWLDKLEIKHNFSVKINNEGLQVEMPENYDVVLYTDDYEKTDLVLTKNNFKKTKSFRPFLDKLPEKHIYDNLTIYNAHGETFVADESEKCHIMGIHGTMVWLLINFKYNDDAFAGYLYYRIWYEVARDFSNGGKLIPHPIKFYGKNNWSDSYLLAIKKHTYTMKGQQLNNLLPRNAYPKKGEKVKEEYYKFDLNTSELLRNDGTEM